LSYASQGFSINPKTVQRTEGMAFIMQNPEVAALFKDPSYVTKLLGSDDVFGKKTWSDSESAMMDYQQRLMNTQGYDQLGQVPPSHFTAASKGVKFVPFSVVHRSVADSFKTPGGKKSRSAFELMNDEDVLPKRHLDFSGRVRRPVKKMKRTPILGHKRSNAVSSSNARVGLRKYFRENPMS